MTALPQPSTSEWPDGLTYFVYSVALLSGDFDSDVFRSQLFKGTKMPKGSHFAFGVSLDAEHTALARFGPDEDGDPELQLTARAQGFEHPQTVAWVAVRDAFSSALKEEWSPVGFAYCTFEFSTDRWQPRITFPIAAPGIADPINGISPQLMGVELTYPIPDLPLRRIGITVADPGRRFSVTQLLRVSVLEQDLYSHICSLLRDYNGLMVVPVNEQERSDVSTP